MQPLIGEIQLFAGKYAPEGWEFCNGQLVSIAEYEALFAIIGTNYGGDGVQTFALPNLSGQVPVGMGQNPQGGDYIIGQSAGTNAVALTAQNIPSHTHTIAAKLKVSSAAANMSSPENHYFGQTSSNDPEYAPTAGSFMNDKGIDIILNNNTNGGTKPVNNIQPFVAIHFIIAMAGVFPSPA
jgi:microcystin-dependent protein